MNALVSAPMALYRYFKPVSKSLPDPDGPLFETLPSAIIRAASKDVLITLKQPKQRPCVILTRVTIYK